MRYFDVSNLDLQRALWLAQERSRWGRWLDRFNDCFWRLFGA